MKLQHTLAYSTISAFGMQISMQPNAEIDHNNDDLKIKRFYGQFNNFIFDFSPVPT